MLLIANKRKLDEKLIQRVRVLFFCKLFRCASTKNYNEMNV